MLSFIQIGAMRLLSYARTLLAFNAVPISSRIAGSSMVAGIVHGSLIISVRNLGYTRNAGEFVKRWFATIGSAGGHRAMAKAVVPLQSFKDKFGNLAADDFTERVLELALEFLHEHPDKKLVKA